MTLAISQERQGTRLAEPAAVGSSTSTSTSCKEGEDDHGADDVRSAVRAPLLFVGGERAWLGVVSRWCAEASAHSPFVRGGSERAKISSNEPAF